MDQENWTLTQFMKPAKNDKKKQTTQLSNSNNFPLRKPRERTERTERTEKKNNNNNKIVFIKYNFYR